MDPTVLFVTGRRIQVWRRSLCFRTSAIWKTDLQLTRLRYQPCCNDHRLALNFQWDPAYRSSLTGIPLNEVLLRVFNAARRHHQDYKTLAGIKLSRMSIMEYAIYPHMIVIWGNKPKNETQTTSPGGKSAHAVSYCLAGRVGHCYCVS